MNSKPKTVSENMLASEALSLINQLGIQGLFIINENNNPICFVHFHDLIRLIKQ